MIDKLCKKCRGKLTEDEIDRIKKLEIDMEICKIGEKIGKLKSEKNVLENRKHTIIIPSIKLRERKNPNVSQLPIMLRDGKPTTLPRSPTKLRRALHGKKNLR